MRISSSPRARVAGLYGLFLLAQTVGADSPAQAFEVRYFTQNPAANGETDFKGKTEFLTTEQRVDFLRAYADYGRIFWHDARLDKEVFSLADGRAVTRNIKPQPRPQVRVRLLDDEWAWHGLPSARTAHKAASRESWLNSPAVSIIDGRLIFAQTGKAAYPIAPALDWRGRLQLHLDVRKTQAESTVALDDGVVVGFDARRRFFYVTAQERVFPDLTLDPGSVALAIDVDFTTRHFNVRVNDRLVADYVPFSDPQASSFAQLEIHGAAGLVLDELYGAAFLKLDADPHYPYAVKTFLDDSFDTVVPIEGWERTDYKDSNWARSALPIVHGGERYAGEDLLLRKVFVVENPAAWSQALLNLETVVPSGTLYVNGKPFEVLRSPKPRQLDILRALKPGMNVIALRIDSYSIPDAEIMTHTSTDRNTGWFAGRIHLDLLRSEALDDVHVFTSSVSSDYAEEDVEVAWHSDRAKPISGKLRISLAPWLPREEKPVVVQEFPISSIPTIQNRVAYRLQVPKPALWTSESPSLYLAKVELLDEAGIVIDDWPVTTGIRTISQEGGTFRINDRPEILRAPLLFGCRAPLEYIAKWDKCAPLEHLVQELMMIRRMNGNGVRLSVHDGKSGGINDPRIAEIADQMGLMLIWQTSAWLREDNIFRMDVDLLSDDVHLVRNHPSIVIWQPANHPKWSGWDNAMVAYRRIYDAITRWDRTRLISPSADFRFLDPTNDDGTLDAKGRPMKADPIWTAPLITRGNMDYICGYGNSWTALRKWPDLDKDEMPIYFEPKPFARTFLESPVRAYFNFEHDESIGQPNWSLIKGQPYYHVASYEADYDVGSIGRPLTFDEWDISQAWQALVSYESIKKMRLMDYDGFSWCCLRGGSNMATYQKSLTDYEGVAKLAFYAHGMVFQNTFAGSDNVDTVYGPADDITPVVFNLGDARTVSLTAQLLSRDGKLIESRNLGRFSLAAGRSFVRGTPFRFSQPHDGAYIVQYVLE